MNTSPPGPLATSARPAPDARDLLRLLPPRADHAGTIIGLMLTGAERPNTIGES